MANIRCRVLSMPYGLMVYWNEVPEAAVYHVHLIVGDSHKDVFDGKVVQDESEQFSEIALIDVPRNFKYYSFTNLAPIHYRKDNFIGTNDHGTGRNYYIVVEAEDRSGNIIATSSKTMGVVEIANNVDVYVGKHRGGF